MTESIDRLDALPEMVRNNMMQILAWCEHRAPRDIALASAIVGDYYAEDQPSPSDGKDSPDGPGWWAFQGRWVDLEGEFTIAIEIAMFRGELLPAYDDTVWPPSDLIGTWTRVYMPWEQQPTLDAGSVPSDATIPMKESKKGE